MSISLSTGNEKLVKPNGGTYRILGWGVPADYDVVLMGTRFITCPGALACKDPCYAKQGNYLRGNVKRAKQGNLLASVLPGFVNNMIAEIKSRRTYNTIRIHDAGDFYSQEYFNKWCDIARALPDRIFYAYTKALHLDLWTDKPENLRIIQSLGGRWDNKVDLTKPHSRIFSSEAARDAAGYVDGNINDVPAIEGVTCIGLVYHGQKKLTLAQVNYFS
jgi:hypothetical protein